MGTALGTVLLSALLSTLTAGSVRAEHEFDSLIKPLVRSIYWQVSNTECTAVHVLNTTDGDLVWKRSPVSFEENWSTQVTDKRGFFTLSTGGPSVTALSLESGSVRWSWPDRQGFAFWQHWATDLPQNAQLATPLPAISTQTVLVRTVGTSSKVVALSLVDGSLLWEYDALPNVTAAAVSAGLSPPQQLSVDVWQLDGLNTVIIALSSQHPVTNTSCHSKQQYRGNCRQASGASEHCDPTSLHASDSIATHNLDDDAPSSDAQVPVVGWIIAVDLLSGKLSWISNPLQQRVASLALSEPAILATTTPSQDGSSSLIGINKNSGSTLYKLPCHNGPCSIQVTDTHIGVLTAGLTARHPTLNTLAAIDLASGKQLWQGLPESKLAALVQGDCTLAVAPRLHLYFACTCSGQARPAKISSMELVQATIRNAGAGQMPIEAQPASLLQIGKQSAGAISTAEQQEMLPVSEPLTPITVDQKRRRRPHPKPQPRPVPDPKPGPGLCAFAVTTQTGKLGFEVVLSSSDAVPAEASAYNMAPLALADSVIFPGVKGVYAVPRISSAATVSNSVAVDTKVQDIKQQKTPEKQGPSPDPTVKPLFSFRLPTGITIQPWDWLDLRSGSLLVHASPNPAVVDPAVADVAAATQATTSDSRQHEPLQKRRKSEQTWIFSLSPQNGTVAWSTGLDISVAPLSYHALPHDWGRGGLLLIDGCKPPVESDDIFNSKQRWFSKAAALSNARHFGHGLDDQLWEEDGSGTSCSLVAISMKNGKIVWSKTFDMDRACSSGFKRRTATHIVYALLSAQVFVLLVGCVLGVIWGRRARAAAAANYLHDPDSEDEGLVVHVLPQAYTPVPQRQ